MNKVYAMAIAAIIALCTACATGRAAIGLSDIDGEWDIVEVAETAVVPAPGQSYPYIGFDVNAGRVYGSTGCNLLTGTFNVDAKAGHIDLSQLGGTRMLCPDMRTEETILAALSTVTRYARIDDTHIVLYHSSRREGIVLRRRNAE